MAESLETTINNDFICGALEGFYGKPWTFEQRKDLFKRLKALNLNTFMYAPKDDIKHRARWRELYSREEAESLRILIEEAKVQGIFFYYSLAPGLDIVYSDQEELDCLIRKYDQILSLGCECFAILFDDIEPKMNLKDSETFKNFASAQVSTTNMIFDHLNKPRFLFCPTEYCGFRAYPNIFDSPYLNTLGVGLQEGIDIMWSGPRVVSRKITVESIEILTQVLRRRPVIWENLHANDYDKRRLFLGPYSGRSTSLIPKLKGVLSNPNCEYEANYIALHTLASWSRCNQDSNEDNTSDTSRQIDESLTSEERNDSSVYDPTRALAWAIRDWLPFWHQQRHHPDYPQQGGLRDDRVASSAAAGSSSSCQQGPLDMTGSKEVKRDPVQMISEQSSAGIAGFFKTRDMETNTPILTPPSEMETSGPDATPPSDMETSNPAASPLSYMEAIGTQVTPPSDMETSNQAASPGSAMETSASNATPPSEMETSVPGSEPPSRMDVAVQATTPPHDRCDSCEMADESEPTLQSGSQEGQSSRSVSVIERSNQPITFDEIALLVDLFFLPFEHGSHGDNLVRDIKWLRDNSYVLSTENQESHSSLSSGSTREEPPDSGSDSQEAELLTVDNWNSRADRVNFLCNSITRLVDLMIYQCSNKALVSELVPYLVDLADLIATIFDYIKFLRCRSSSREPFDWSQNVSEAPQKDIIECVDTGGDQEPWVFRGGLIGEIRRIMY